MLDVLIMSGVEKQGEFTSEAGALPDSLTKFQCTKEPIHTSRSFEYKMCDIEILFLFVFVMQCPSGERFVLVHLR